MFEFIMKGGPLMWPILLCSVISATIVLERLYKFHRARIKIPNMLSKVKNLIKNGKADEAIKLCEEASDPISHLLVINIIVL